MKLTSIIYSSFLLISIFFLVQCSKNNDPAVEAPTLVSFSPASGATGTIVTLTGTNFSTTLADNAVMFNGVAATVSAATATSLTVTVPTGASTGKITVTVNNQTATSANDFIVINGPSISSYSPTSGTEGTLVVITGENFSATAGENTVKFNGTTAVVTEASVTSLSVNVPEGASDGKITVTVNGLTATSADDFLVTTTDDPSITSFSPTSGRNGTTVIISGLNFSTTPSKNIVLFAGKQATVTNATSKSLTVVVPSAAATGKITVTVNDVIATSSDNFMYLYTVSTLAGSGNMGYSDGTGTGAEFYFPYGITIDASGILYVADEVGHSIRKITSDGVVTTLTTVGALPEIMGVAVDLSGNFYIVGDGANYIYKATANGTVSILAGTGVGGFADGSNSTAQFYEPHGVAVDANGNVYIGDTRNHRIRKITPGGTVSTLAGSGTAGDADGDGTSAQFNYPAGIAVDANGNVYVADSNNGKIRKITAGGSVTTLFRCGAPAGVTVDADGNVYVVGGDQAVLKMTPTTPTPTVSTIAGGLGYGFVDGTTAVAKFGGPTGVVVDANGNIYVADLGNNRIRKIEDK